MTPREELLCRAVFDVWIERIAAARSAERLRMDPAEVEERCRAAVPDASEAEMVEAYALVLAMCQMTERHTEGRPLH